jgi:KDEL-tailed cysteine endopeptidase
MARLTALWACAALLIVAMISVASAALYTPKSELARATQLWEKYIIDNKLSFKTPEARERRFQIFHENLDFIGAFNSKPGKKDKLQIGPHMHYTTAEFIAFRTGKNKDAEDDNQKRGVEELSGVLTAEEIARIPKAFDWRNKTTGVDKVAVIGPIRSQGICGSCWAHAAGGILESHWALKHGSRPSLAPQHLVDCTPYPSKGCKSGSVTASYLYILNNNGQHTEESYPYKGYFPYYGYTQPCSNFTENIGAKVATGVNGKPYVWLPKNSTASFLMNYIAKNGPVVGTLNANKAVMHWGKRVMMASDCDGPDSNHYIQIVGYGNKDGIPVWIVKNSWSVQWGDRGFFYLQRNATANPCHLLDKVIAPVVA